MKYFFFIIILFLTGFVFANDDDYCFFSETIKLNNEASDYQYKYQNSMTQKRFSNLMKMREKIYNLTLRINISELADYNSSLPSAYKKFIDGQYLQINGWKNANSESIYKGQVKLNEFGAWFNKNRKKLNYPKVKKSYCKKILK